MELYKDRAPIMTDTFKYTPNELPPSNLFDYLRYSVLILTIITSVIVIVIYFPRIIAFMYMKCYGNDQ